MIVIAVTRITEIKNRREGFVIKKQNLRGKRISILGDSISTHVDMHKIVTVNPVTVNNPQFYRGSFPIEKTYWMRLIDNLGMKLCVNNAWASGRLSGVDNENSGMNRARYLASDNGEIPDLIVVFMGINDLGSGVDAAIFASDYDTALRTMKAMYPTAMVCCINIPDRDRLLRARALSFNEAIDKAVLNAGDNFFVADLFHSRLNNDFYYMNTVDGLHPDEDGMMIIAEIVQDAICAKLEV